jgi:Protein of unknown function (DUF2865)
MLRFFGRLTLAVAAIPLAWATLLGHQPPTPEPRAVASSGPAAQAQVTTTGEMLVTAEWFDRIFKGMSQEDEVPIPRPKRLGGTYRTLCVRLCDGFYFPISYATRRERFVGDSKQCEQRCPGRSRLFVHRNPGEDVDKMVALDGRPYSSLPTAFLHRTKHVKDCACGGLPWEEDALAKHRAYAAAAKRTISGKIAVKAPPAQSERYAPKGLAGAQ